MCRVRLEDGEKRIWLSSIVTIDNGDDEDKEQAGGGDAFSMQAMQKEIEQLKKKLDDMKQLLAKNGIR